MVTQKLNRNLWLVVWSCLSIVGCQSKSVSDVQSPESGGSQSSTVCGDTTSSTPGLKSGKSHLSFDAEARLLTLCHQDEERLKLRLDSLSFGLVGKISDDYNYDPTYLRDEYGPLLPAGFQWRNPKIEEARWTDLDVVFPLELDGKKGALIFRVDGENRFTAELTAPKDLPIAYLKVATTADSKEGFYGLGEVFDVVNHRGKVRPMHILPEPEVESLINDIHAPIPFILGTRGWGLFAKTYYPTVFEVAVDDDETVAFAVATAGEGGNSVSFSLFTEDHPLDLTRHYYELTGWPKLPAQWALGPWIWRDENRDQAQVINDIKTIRDLDLATSGYWIDRPYASGVNSFDFKESQFPNPEEMIKFIHDNGFRFALWHTPYLSDEDANKELKSHAEENGFYPPSIGLFVSQWGPLIDLTNPEAFAWWSSLIKRYTDMGVEGFKLDYGEEVVPGVEGLRSGWRFADGSSDRTMHAVYQYWYHKVYADLMPETGGFMLTRTATWGDQVNGLIIWPGDLDATLTQRYDAVKSTGKSYKSVGGLPAALVAGLSLGPSGFPFYGSDTGGYRNAPPNKETFTRWFQQTSLSTVMQIGTNTNDVAWEFKDENGFDEEMLDWYRRYTRLHLRLFPYEWTYAQDILVSGRAIQRPYGLQYPRMNHHPSDTYFFGDDLLVAPVMEDGVRKRSVLFPPGIWYDWWTGQSFESDTPLDVNAPLDTLPLFIRAGGIVPLLRPNIDTLSPVNADGIESYAKDPGSLYVRIARGPDHTFSLFDKSKVSVMNNEDRFTISAEEGEQFKGQIRYEVIGLNTLPEAVTEDATTLPKAQSLTDLDTEHGWYFESSTKRLHIQTEMKRIIVVSPKN